MSLKERQQHLTEQIKTIKDEQVLAMLEEEVAFYLHAGGTDITDNLTAYQLKELISLSEEPDGKDIVSEDEFKKVTDKWRTK